MLKMQTARCTGRLHLRHYCMQFLPACYLLFQTLAHKLLLQVAGLTPFNLCSFIKTEETTSQTDCVVPKLICPGLSRHQYTIILMYKADLNALQKSINIPEVKTNIGSFACLNIHELYKS